MIDWVKNYVMAKARTKLQAGPGRTGYSWEFPLPGDAYLHIRFRRSTLVAVIGSLLVHALVLFIIARQHLLIGDAPAQQAAEPMIVRLNLLTPPMAQNPLSNTPEPQPEPAPKPQAKPHPPKAPPIAVVAAAKPVVDNLVVPVNPVTPPPPMPRPVAATDLLTYLNAARARRRAAAGITEQDDAEAVASERRPADDEVRMANIKRNLNPGTNGIFQIISMDARSATFSFRGWTTDRNNSRRELIEVDAGPKGDIQRAVVRRMIEIIRKYYRGDFNWESVQLGREVILSARMEDNAGLEDFLMREFFGGGGGIPAP
ncbi:MAG: hypothetical protein D4R48_03270 [Nitrosomonadales bacterium]|nr:MAG: hypothetical protein D4R48_03270 [Nitrosomonadales bacterium]